MTADPDTRTEARPPYDLGAERVVLSAALTRPGYAEELVARIPAAAFWKPQHGHLWNLVGQMLADRKPVDLVTVCQEVHERGVEEAVGGIAYVADLVSDPLIHVLPDNAVRTVLELSRRRRYAEAADEILQSAWHTPAPAMAARLQKLLSEQDAVADEDVADISTVISKMVDQVEERAESGCGITGVPTGLLPLDTVTGGFHGGEMIVLAARPGMGKTAMALTWARNMARAGRRVGFLSLEMSGISLAERFAAMESGVPAQEIRTGRATRRPGEWGRIVDALTELSNSRMIISDLDVPSLAALQARGRKMVKQGAEILFLDYLQLARSGNKRHSAFEEATEVSREVKVLARRLDIPVVAISQLSRAVEQRTGGHKRPVLSDLRQTGQIEQDADQVMFIYRPEVYAQTPEELDKVRDKYGSNYAELILAKHRQGPTTTAKLTWRPERMEFVTRA